MSSCKFYWFLIQRKVFLWGGTQKVKLLPFFSKLTKFCQSPEGFPPWNRAKIPKFAPPTKFYFIFQESMAHIKTLIYMQKNSSHQFGDLVGHFWGLPGCILKDVRPSKIGNKCCSMQKRWYLTKKELLGINIQQSESQTDSNR